MMKVILNRPREICIRKRQNAIYFFPKDILRLDLEPFKGELLLIFQKVTLTACFQKPTCLKIPHC